MIEKHGGKSETLTALNFGALKGSAVNSVLTTFEPAMVKNQTILPSLSKILAYQNNQVVEKFIDKWAVGSDAAKDIFEETKKFLYLAHVAHAQGFNFEIDEPTSIIDEMWHAFILSTKDYSNFCQLYFGRMLHHAPFTKSSLDAKQSEYIKNGQSFSMEKSNHLRKQLELIDTHLGESTIEKWYIEYASEYSPRNMNSLQRPIFFTETQYAEIPVGNSQTIGDKDSLITDVLRRQISSGFCGGHGCGIYCSCNSNVLRF